jgi:hypothetical protein
MQLSAIPTRIAPILTLDIGNSVLVIGYSLCFSVFLYPKTLFGWGLTM